MIDLFRSASGSPARVRAGLVGALLLTASAGVLPGCELFQPGTDRLTGAGPRAFEPYQGRKSGVLRLSLQQYNGCGVQMNGSNTGPGSLAADAGSAFTYPYPATCRSLHGATGPSTRFRPMPVAVGEPYFLDELAIVDTVTGLHTDPGDQRAPLDWFRKSSRFKNLDWSNAGVVADDWEGDRAALGGFTRTLRYGGAAWMSHEGEDNFLVEIVDRDGNVVASMDYPRDSFALENPIGFHTQFIYTYGTVGKPEFMGDSRVNPVPTQPIGGANVRPPTFTTRARFQVQAQTRPHNRTFVIPEELRGQDGVARVTWSQLPDEPFYFPLTFSTREDEQDRCWADDESGEQVPCDFGLEPTARLTPPKNGQFYEPGETFQIVVAYKDAMGNLLHPPDSLPSFNDFLAGKSNGLLYQYSSAKSAMGDASVWSSMSLQGPIQRMKPFYGLESESGWFSQWGRGFIPSTAANNNLLGGARDIPMDTRWPVALPQDAEPGTYVFTLKGNRQFMGERMVHTNTVYLQVGQAERTQYPQRVGNCDICHMGPTSLSNISMGMDTGAVEACKSCHGSTTTKFVHQIHINSDHYPVRKNDCTVCHLKYEGAIRSSILTCTACHMQAHAAQFFEQTFTAVTTSAEPNLQSNCAVTCHDQNPPTAHIIPPNRSAEEAQ